MYRMITGILVLSLAAWGCEQRSSTSERSTNEASLTSQGKQAAEQDESRRTTKQETPRPAEEEDVSVERAPERFAVKLETTKGDIIIDVTRGWAPNGADRFHELVKAGYYTDCAFFRVISGFMAQVGISGEPAKNTLWRAKRIQDDPVRESNKRGRVTFAMAGPNTRTTQIFINFRDNRNLDGMNFAPFGQVRDMATVDALHSGYGEGAPRGKGPSQARLQQQGNSYLRAEFPNLDYIQKASIVR